MSAVVRRRAPAKLNLWLHVLGRRPDGYHEVETVLCALELADELEVRVDASGAVALAVGGPCASADVPTDARNLAHRAATAALARARELGLVAPEVGLALALEKRVPSQAGLGGGSSDAACALLAAERALGADFGAAWRRAWLAAAGADCVFFHDVGASGLATCRGVGERVEPCDATPPAWWAWVVTPAVACATAEVFRAWRAQAAGPTRAPARLDASLLGAPVGAWRERLHNDLEAPALAVAPELAAWRALLERCGEGHARLTGSGSSFFALHADEASACAALERVRAAAAEAGLDTRLACVTRPRGPE